MDSNIEAVGIYAVFFSVGTQNTAKNTIFVYVKTADCLHRSIFYWDTKPVGHMRIGKTYDLVFTTKIVAVLTFLFTGRKKSVFLYNFALTNQVAHNGMYK